MHHKWNFKYASLMLVSIIWNILSTLLKVKVSPVRLELTPSCVAPNHPRGLYYRGLAAHLTPQRRSGGVVGEIGTSAPLLFHMVEQHAQQQTTCTHTHKRRLPGCTAEPLRVCVCVCYTRQQREHLTLRLSTGETPIKNTDVKVAAGLADSAIHPTAPCVC